MQAEDIDPALHIARAGGISGVGPRHMIGLEKGLGHDLPVRLDDHREMPALPHPIVGKCIEIARHGIADEIAQRPGILVEIDIDIAVIGLAADFAQTGPVELREIPAGIALAGGDRGGPVAAGVAQRLHAGLAVADDDHRAAGNLIFQIVTDLWQIVEPTGHLPHAVPKAVLLTIMLFARQIVFGRNAEALGRAEIVAGLEQMQ